MSIAQICQHTFITTPLRRESKILDLGVNNCEFSLKISSLIPGCKIFGVEANPILFSRLPKLGNFKAINAAVASSTGKILFYKSKDADGSIIFKDRITAETEVFEVNSVDLIKIHQLSNFNIIDLIKIDIEGAELEIFETMSEDFWKNNVKQITVEFHDFLQLNHLDRIKSIILKMKSLGFYSYAFSGRDFSDVLFINKRYINVSLILKLKLILIKYFNGGFRIIKRKFNKV